MVADTGRGSETEGHDTAVTYASASDVHTGPPVTPRVHRFAAAAFGLTLTLGVAALLLSGPRAPRPTTEPLSSATTTPPAPAPGRAPTSTAPSAGADDLGDPVAPPDDGAPGPVTPAPVTSARTSIVVLRLADDGVELVTRATKPFACPPAEPPTSPSAARWRLVDRTSGALLAEGALELPRLCDCPKGRDHRRGCVVVHHSAVVRLKLPRLAARERLELVRPERPVGTIDLPEAS